LEVAEAMVMPDTDPAIPLGFCFVWKGTKRSDRTKRASRAFGEANTAAVVLEEVAKTDALRFRDERREVEFDLVWVCVLRESESLRKAHDVSVHPNCLLPEDITEQDVSGFSADAGESKKVVEFAGNFTVEALDDFVAAVVNRPRLISIEIYLADLFFQLRERRTSIVIRCPVFFEKIDCHSIDQIIPGLRRQD
jgi:hypothetical protein